MIFQNKHKNEVKKCNTVKVAIQAFSIFYHKALILPVIIPNLYDICDSVCVQ